MWYMVYGIWYTVYGIRYTVYGIWYIRYRTNYGLSLTTFAASKLAWIDNVNVVLKTISIQTLNEIQTSGN